MIPTLNQNGKTVFNETGNSAAFTNAADTHIHEDHKFLSEDLAQTEVRTEATGMLNEVDKKVRSQKKKNERSASLMITFSVISILLFMGSDNVLTYFGANVKADLDHKLMVKSMTDSLYTSNKILDSFDDDMKRIEDQYSSTIAGYTVQINDWNRKARQYRNSVFHEQRRREAKALDKAAYYTRLKSEAIENQNNAIAKLKSDRVAERGSISDANRFELDKGAVSESKSHVFLVVSLIMPVLSFLIVFFGKGVTRYLSVLPQMMSSYYNYFAFSTDASLRYPLGYYNEFIGADYISAIGVLMMIIFLFGAPVVYSQALIYIEKALAKKNAEPDVNVYKAILGEISTLNGLAVEKVLADKLMSIQKQLALYADYYKLLDAIKEKRLRVISDKEEVSAKEHSHNMTVEFNKLDLENAANIYALQQMKDHAEMKNQERIELVEQEAIEKKDMELEARSEEVPSGETAKEIGYKIGEMIQNGTWDDIKKKYNLTIDGIAKENQIDTPSNISKYKNEYLNNQKKNNQTQDEKKDEQSTEIPTNKAA